MAGPPLPRRARPGSARVGVVARLARVFGGDNHGSVQSLIALALLAVASVIAGLALGSSTDRLEEFPGLLLLVPAAIALRGNIFGALGSRLGTAIHSGTFRLSVRPGTVVGQNVLGSLVLTVVLSAVTAVLAKVVAVAFGIPNSISLADYVVISVVGGLLASAVVLVLALAMAAGAVRYDWDPDDVTAPLVTAARDVVTLPALVLASMFVSHRATTVVIALIAGLTAVAAVVAVVRFGDQLVREIVRDSIPVLTFAALLDLIAGVTVERKLIEFQSLPALLVLLPGYLAAAGALGGILSSRLSSKLHLGFMEPTGVPGKGARADMVATFVLALPVFLLTAVLVQLGSSLVGLDSPGLLDLVLVALLGGFLATILVEVVAYYGTIAAVRFGADPDTYGIPLVTSVLDLVGAFTLILALELVGVI